MTVDRRWLVISEDGRHNTLGRHSDPTEEEIRSVEAALVMAGTGGWLAVTEGIYHSRGKLEVLRVRVLGKPTADWETAVAHFLEIRKRAVN